MQCDLQTNLFVDNIRQGRNKVLRQGLANGIG